MTMLTKIGNSQGVRIPKPLIVQAHLENVQIDFEVVENGLLIKPVHNKTRENWENNIQDVLTKNINVDDVALLDEFLNDSDLEDYEW